MNAYHFRQTFLDKQKQKIFAYVIALNREDTLYGNPSEFVASIYGCVKATPQTLDYTAMFCKPQPVVGTFD